MTLQAQLRQIPTRFKGYEKYSFDDATKYFETEEREIVSGTTDQQGTLQLTTGGLASLEGLSPGMLSGKFTVKVFEKSGDFSVDQQIIPVSPYDAYFGIGVTPPGRATGADEYLDSKKEHLLRIVMLDAQGRALPGRRRCSSRSTRSPPTGGGTPRRTRRPVMRKMRSTPATRHCRRP